MAENIEEYFDGLTLADDCDLSKTKLKLEIPAVDSLVSICRIVSERLKDPRRHNKAEDLEQFIKFLHLTTVSKDRNSMERYDELASGSNDESHDECKQSLEPVVECIESIFQYGEVGELKEHESVYYEEDFTGVHEKSSLSMNCFGVLFSVFQNGSFGGISAGLMDTLAYRSLILAVEHSEDLLWTSGNSRELAEQLLGKVYVYYECGSREGFFKLPKPQRKLLNRIETKMTRKVWKQNPSAKHLYKWSLFGMRSGSLGDHLDKMLPPTLILLDDHELEHKMIGLECMMQILNLTSKTELLWLGRAEVIFDSLQKLMYTHEPSVISSLHPCLVKVLFIIEPDPKRGNTPRKLTKFDAIFHRFLNDMELEDKITVRRSYSHQLPLYVQSLGIAILKHVKTFLHVTMGYLGVHDGPKEEARENILHSVELFIKECWPRVANHCEVLVQGLVRFIYDMSTDKSNTSATTQQGLIKRAVDCLLLIKVICPEKLHELLSAILTVDLGTNCNEYIRCVIGEKVKQEVLREDDYKNVC